MQFLLPYSKTRKLVEITKRQEELLTRDLEKARKGTHEKIAEMYLNRLFNGVMHICLSEERERVKDCLKRHESRELFEIAKELREKGILKEEDLNTLRRMPEDYRMWLLKSLKLKLESSARMW